MNILTGFLGTYASPESLGIYRFTIDLRNGAMSYPELYYDAPDCKYLSLEDCLLASPLKRGGKSGICLLDTAHNNKTDAPVLLGEDFEETSPACYVVQDNQYVYTANYHEGTVLIYERSRHESDSLRLIKRIDIAPKAGCHQIFFHSHYMMVPCLLLDKVMIFDCSRNFAAAGELSFEKGTGPRHGIFDRDHKYLYLISELSNQVFVYKLGTEAEDALMPDLDIRLLRTYQLLPKDAVYGEPPASAAIRLSPDERFLYISTRFAEIITVFKIDNGSLEQIQQTGCGGIHPRDMILTPDGRFLLVANRTKGGLVSFRIDPDSGQLSEICSRVPAPEAVSVVLAHDKV